MREQGRNNHIRSCQRRDEDRCRCSSYRDAYRPTDVGRAGHRARCAACLIRSRRRQGGREERRFLSASGKDTSAPVLSDGSLYSSSHAGTTVERFATGRYTIRWLERAAIPDKCGAVATPLYLSGDPYHVTIDGVGEIVGVQIYNEAGAYVDIGFHVLAVC